MDGDAIRFDGEGRERELASGVVAAAWSQEALLIASKLQILLFDEQGQRLATHSIGSGVTALTKADNVIVLGYQDGNIEVRSSDDTFERRVNFEDVPSSSVVAMVPGPSKTLLAGFSNGALGIWSLENGTKLHSAQLHGPVRHLLLRGHRLYAASELGSHVTIDLGVFNAEYCDLMREIWASVPVSWVEGAPVAVPVPQDHPCNYPTHN